MESSETNYWGRDRVRGEAGGGGGHGFCRLRGVADVGDAEGDEGERRISIRQRNRGEGERRTDG